MLARHLMVAPLNHVVIVVGRSEATAEAVSEGVEVSTEVAPGPLIASPMTRQKSSSVLICLPSSTYVGVTARRIRAAPRLRPLDSGRLRLVRKSASGLTEIPHHGLYVTGIAAQNDDGLYPDRFIVLGHQRWADTIEAAAVYMARIHSCRTLHLYPATTLRSSPPHPVRRPHARRLPTAPAPLCTAGH